jgi:hypothetical protein
LLVNFLSTPVGSSARVVVSAFAARAGAAGRGAARWWLDAVGDETLRHYRGFDQLGVNNLADLL